MAFIRLTKEQKKKVLNELDVNEKTCLETAIAVLQKIVGIYLERPNGIEEAEQNAEMADLYRNVVNTLSDLRNCND